MVPTERPVTTPEAISALMARAASEPEKVLAEGEGLLPWCREHTPELAPRLALALALAANNCVRLDEGVPYLAEAIRGFSSFDPQQAFRALRLTSGVLRSAGETTIAQRCLRFAETFVAAFPDEERDAQRAVLLDDQALVASQAGDFRRFLALARESVALSTARSAHSVMRLELVAQAYRLIGQPQTAWTWLERALPDRDLLPPILAAAFDAECATLAHALGTPWALARLEALEAAAGTLGSPPVHACAMIPLALRLANARPLEAIELSRRAARGLAFGGNRYVASSLLATAAQSAENVGDLDLASALHRERFEQLQHPSTMQMPALDALRTEILNLAVTCLEASDPASNSGFPVHVTIVVDSPALDADIDQLLLASQRPTPTFSDDAAALRARVGAEDRARLARIALAEAAACINRDLSALAVPHLLYAMRHIDALSSHAERARLLRSLGRALEMAGFTRAAVEVATDSVERAGRAQAHGERVRSLLSLGVLYSSVGQPADARRTFEQTIDAARQAGGAVRREIEPLALAALAYVQRIEGELADAYATIQEAMASLTPEADAFAPAQVIAERWAILSALGAPLDIDDIERNIDAWAANGHAQQVGDAARVVATAFAARDPDLTRRFADRALEGLEAAELSRDALQLFDELIEMEKRQGHARRVLDLERRRADMALRERSQRDKIALAIDPLREKLCQLGVLSTEAAV